MTLLFYAFNIHTYVAVFFASASIVHKMTMWALEVKYRY